MTAKRDTMKKIKDTKNSDNKENYSKCHQCEFVCQKRETLNTQHRYNTEAEASYSVCSICDDKLKIKSEFFKH